MRTRKRAAARAFRDAVRDIIASEGWFEVLIDPRGTPTTGELRLLARLLPKPLATS